jgi:hypothetical protein
VRLNQAEQDGLQAATASRSTQPLNAFDIWRNLMKLVQSLIVAALVAVPAVSFAQAQQQPVTRAEVRAELVQLQKAGYNPSSDNTQYPKNIEAALARVHAEDGSAAAAYGGVAQSTADSGSRAPMNRAQKSHAPQTESEVIGLGPIYAHS